MTYNVIDMKKNKTRYGDLDMMHWVRDALSVEVVVWECLSQMCHLRRGLEVLRKSSMWVPGRIPQKKQPVQRHLAGSCLPRSQQGVWCG